MPPISFRRDATDTCTGPVSNPALKVRAKITATLRVETQTFRLMRQSTEVQRFCPAQNVPEVQRFGLHKRGAEVQRVATDAQAVRSKAGKGSSSRHWVADLSVAFLMKWNELKNHPTWMRKFNLKTGLSLMASH
jgi:hypothetical protein